MTVATARCPKDGANLRPDGGCNPCDVRREYGRPDPPPPRIGLDFALPTFEQDAPDRQDSSVTEGIDRFPRIDWRVAFATDYSQIDWLPGKFMERGQQVALVGDGKVGKSLFVLDWLWRCATGRSFLGDDQREPLRILYFDRENNQRDIITRLRSLGAEADLEDLLERFDYRLFPRFSGGLDAAGIAATEMLGIVEESRPDIVVLDTVSRFIAGKENDSDTWLQLYARVHAPLKSMNIGGVRLDHFGKDTERGGRGSSAKSQDVDHVWEMTSCGENALRTPAETTVVTDIKLKRSHTRTGLGDDLMMLRRRGIKGSSGIWLPGRTRHELAAPDEPQSVAAQVRNCVDELISRGVPTGLSRSKLVDWARENGVKLPGKTTTLADVVIALKSPQGEAA